MIIKCSLAALVLTIFTACGGSGNSIGIENNVTGQSEVSGSSPLDSGTGFVFAVAERYSNNPLAIVDVALIERGDTPRLDVLHNGSSFLPYRHSSGNITVTEPCFVGVIEYRRISVLSSTGTTNPITPCSNQIQTPGGFTWIGAGKLSPAGQRLAAQLFSPGDPPITVVYEGGREIARYTGYGYPAWIDDNTMVLVGTKLLTVQLGENPVVITDRVSGFSIGRVAVSPSGSRVVFEWESALWIINTDGTGLRQLLPANRYVHPAWSPDGRWVATMQQQAPSVLDAQLVGSGAVGTDFVFTNFQEFTLVSVDTGEVLYADLTIHLNDSQMPQGGLSWY